MERTKRILLKAQRKLLLPCIKLVSRQIFDKAFYSLLRRGGVKLVGEPYFISDDIFLDDTDWSRITIEENVTISKGVTILIHDFSVSNAIELHEKDIYRAYLRDDVILKRNCFIGANTIILPGTIIGENTIIGAGCVVKGKIPDGVLLAGNPARIIKTIDEYYDRIKQLPENKLTRVKKKQMESGQ